MHSVCMLQGCRWVWCEAGKAPEQVVIACLVTLLDSGCLSPVVAQSREEPARRDSPLQPACSRLAQSTKHSGAQKGSKATCCSAIKTDPPAGLQGFQAPAHSQGLTVMTMSRGLSSQRRRSRAWQT